MRDADGNRLDDIRIKERLERGSYTPRDSLSGLAATDAPTVTTGSAVDATFNETYAIAGNALPAIWPIDAYGDFAIASNTWLATVSDTPGGSPGIACSTTHRIMCDGDAFQVFGYGTGFEADLFIDGRPYASNPISLAVTTGFSPFGLTKLVFGSAKPRLLEWRTSSGIVAVYTKKPYRLWKPAPDPNPRIAVVGDSYVAPAVMSDTVAGQITSGMYESGIYQRLGAVLGLTSLVTDGIGGTGYLNGGGSATPYGHANRLAWLSTLNPDVVMVHGGGANDIFGGNTDAATIAAAIAYFQAVRALLPDAKLVFVEGMSPPGFAYNTRYATVSAGVRSGLADLAGIYFLDLATTRPPLNGTGYVTAANGTGNNDIYAGSDTYHLSRKGSTYLRHVIATKMRRVLADNGPLEGTLIL